jgi:polyhydroxyalkanoate synthesis regulator phasin
MNKDMFSMPMVLVCLTFMASAHAQQVPNAGINRGKVMDQVPDEPYRVKSVPSPDKSRNEILDALASSQTKVIESLARRVDALESKVAKLESRSK